MLHKYCLEPFRPKQVVVVQDADPGRTCEFDAPVPVSKHANILAIPKQAEKRRAKTPDQRLDVTARLRRVVIVHHDDLEAATCPLLQGGFNGLGQKVGAAKGWDGNGDLRITAAVAVHNHVRGHQPILGKAVCRSQVIERRYVVDRGFAHVTGGGCVVRHALVPRIAILIGLSATIAGSYLSWASEHTVDSRGFLDSLCPTDTL